MTNGQASPSTPRACGACSLCCKVYPFPEIGKPAGQWCQQHVPGRGCGVQPTKPAVCRRYQCAWTLNETLDEAWKPSIARFVMDIRPGEILLVVDPDQPDAWRREPYFSRIKMLSARVQRPFTTVLLFERGHLFVVFPEDEIDLGPNQPGREIDSGYEERNGERIPYARYAGASA